MPGGMHRHDTPEICIALAGRGAMHVGEQVCGFCSPQVAIFPPGTLHAEGFASAGVGYAVMWLHGCSDSSLIGVVSVYRPGQGWMCTERYSLKSRTVRDLLRRISEAGEEIAAGFEAVRADLLSILAAMNRQRVERPSRKAGAGAADVDHAKLLKRVQEFLDNNYTKPIDVGSVAMLARFSPNYLNGLFSRWKGQGIREYVIARRMEKAMELCRGGGMLVKEVSQRLGYSDPFYFSRAFRRYHGVWPTEAGLG